MNFKDKVVIITGASSGIGYALVYEFASHGAKIALGARSEGKLARIAEDLETRGTEAVYEATDVTREADCRRLIERTVERFGRIDILICNAGISMRALFDDVDLDVLRQLMDVNFWGAVYCTKYALPYLQASKGSIVGVSSVAGIHGLPGRTGYSASKYAMTGFMETNDRGPRLHGVECPLLGIDGRRIGSGRISARGREDDERGRSRAPDRSGNQPSQTHPVDGIQRKGYDVD